MKKGTLLIALLVAALFVGLILSIGEISSPALTEQESKVTQGQGNMEEESETVDACVPVVAGGGGPYYRAGSLFRDSLVPPDAAGERILISGRVLYSDCVTPVPDAVLDIWHADANGEYQDQDYRGKVRADANGIFSFTTVYPARYRSGSFERPRHIHYKVFSSDDALLTSQMYFEDNRGNVPNVMIVDLQDDANADGVREGTLTVVLPLSAPSSQLVPSVPTPTPTTPAPFKACIVTGCSGQVCAAQEVITTCEYLPEYACYGDAACEIQPDGGCGWTPTTRLEACIASSGEI